MRIHRGHRSSSKEVWKPVTILLLVSCMRLGHYPISRLLLTSVCGLWKAINIQASYWNRRCGSFLVCEERAQHEYWSHSKVPRDSALLVRDSEWCIVRTLSATESSWRGKWSCGEKGFDVTIVPNIQTFILSAVNNMAGNQAELWIITVRLGLRLAYATGPWRLTPKEWIWIFIWAICVRLTNMKDQP